jgi:hypothetical protein
MELLMVPHLRSSQLLSAYELAQAGNPYDYAGWPAVTPPAPPTPPMLPYPHLLSFFQSPDPTGLTPTLGFYRLFDYLRVPSPFLGTDVQIDPTNASSGNHCFYPPFNRVSTYREPGRINLNTIYSPTVWQGLMNSLSSNGANQPLVPVFNDFVASRRNDGGTSVLAMPGMDCPTEFARPFRSASRSTMVPKLTPDTLTPHREVDATVLREKVTAVGPTGTPLFQVTSADPAENTDRNPFFRYQGLERLGNLATTRSNVYAVWITVGYFEVTPASQLPGYPWGLTAAQLRARYPDGYTLGRELGVDTGEIERHRAFYIFDRTIPVGFQRGQDLNTDKAILVNRFIE